MLSSLVSTQNHVESPFIIVKIGDYTFGHCEKSQKGKLKEHFSVTYPNYMNSLNITKINGAINTYVLTMTYAITAGDDPNLLEKIFSRAASKTRLIKLSYGDWNAPAFIYKEEEATITKLSTRVDMSRSTIQYVINCTSNALSLTAGTFSFSARRAKPSNVLLELLSNKGYGLTNIFKGMSGNDFSSFIARDDREVDIDARSSTSILDYISYLVSCMVWVGDKDSGIKTSCYFWSVYDDTSGVYGGTYFKVVRVAANASTSLSYNTYELNIGYPTSEYILSFNINNDDSWALLYDYAQDVSFPQYSYLIDNEGNLVKQEANVMTKSKVTHSASESTRNWWSLVTQFPITATVTLKGLLRPAMLMSYVKVNTYFYGRKHISSGLYIITKQEDTIQQNSGYRTTLTLTRVGGDESYV